MPTYPDHRCLTRPTRREGRPSARLLTCLLLLPLFACKDSEGPSDLASLSGTVRSATSSAALADASVSIGARQVTSDANGRFEFADVPLGTASIRVERPGYVPAQADITVAAGTNTRDFALAPREIYEAGANAVYVPAGVETIRGAIILLGGPNTRGFVTGERMTPTTFPPENETALQLVGANFRELARSAGLALLGTSVAGMANGPASDNALFAGLNAAAVGSGHSEVATVPVLMYGISGGGSEAAGLASRHPERTIGLLVRIPGEVTALTAASALAVPTLVMQAELDNVVNNAEVESAFLANRSRGGLWALAVEPGIGHFTATPRGNAAELTWMRIVLGLRLPASPGGPLVSLAESSGWLGNQSTLEVAPWSDYTGDRTEASWLLSQQAAASWRTLGSSEGGGT